MHSESTCTIFYALLHLYILIYLASQEASQFQRKGQNYQCSHMLN